MVQAQILDVVRANYDSLTLKLQDSLDLFESYAENPTFTSFFTNLVRSMVTDYRQVPVFLSYLLYPESTVPVMSLYVCLLSARTVVLTEE